MATRNKRSDVDALVAYLFLKKMMTPIRKMDAFKMGIVDGTGKVVRKPRTEREKQALTLLDKIILRIKRLLGNRIAKLFNFLYLQTLNNDLYNSMIVMGSVQQRAEIKRIANDINRLQESHGINNSEDMAYVLIEEYLTQIQEDEILNS